MEESCRDVLTLVMRKHQRYFAVTDASGDLLPMFIAVANGPIDADIVTAGNLACSAALDHLADLNLQDG